MFVYDRVLDVLESVGTTASSSLHKPRLSDDGTAISFISSSSTLVPNDTNSRADAFLYNRLTGAMTRVSVAADGTQSNQNSNVAVISGDGNSVVFNSQSTTLIPSVSSQFASLFVWDRETSALSSPSLVLNSTASVFQSTIVETLQSNFAVSGKVQLADSLLVNTSVANLNATVVVENVMQNPLAGVSNYAPLTRSNHLPPVHALLRGNPAIDAGSSQFIGSADQVGSIRVIPDIGAMESVSGSVSGTIYVDLNANQILEFNEPRLAGVDVEVDSAYQVQYQRTDTDGSFAFHGLGLGGISVRVIEPEFFKVSALPIQRVLPIQGITSTSITDSSVSHDGRFVVFTSSATNLVPGDTNGKSDIFVFDRVLQSVERVNVANDGTQSNGESARPSISGDGRFVVYQSSATNLTASDMNGYEDVFLFDRVSRTVERVSNSSIGTQAIMAALLQSLVMMDNTLLLTHSRRI